MNVYPRKPLILTHNSGAIYALEMDGPLLDSALVCSPKDIAEHFYPAERLDTLIAAVVSEVEYHAANDAYGDPVPDGQYAECNCALCVAFRAFREQVTA